MHAKLAFLLLPMAFSATVFAAGSAGEIRQIDSAKSLAAVSLRTANVRAGDTLIATSKDKSQCSLTVKSVKHSIALTDISACAFASQLRVGQSLEQSLMDDIADEPAPVVAPAPVKKSARAKTVRSESSGPMSSNSSSSSAYGDSMAKISEVVPASQILGWNVFAFYDTTTSFEGGLKFQGESYNATLDSEGALGVGGEYVKFNPQFVGFYGEGALEMNRALKGGTANGNKITYDKNPSLSMLLVSGGANYTLNDNFYVKGGLNFNLPNVSGGGITSASGKLGYEGGVGVRFARRFNAELLYRKISMSLSGKFNNIDDNYSMDNLSATGVALRGGYLF